jgi:hypothetical protein
MQQEKNSTIMESDLCLSNQLTVEAWVTTSREIGDGVWPLVSKWKVNDSFDSFDAFDAGCTDGLNSKGYFGAVFDGRYIYFSPEQRSLSEYHGVVLRYDTRGDFKDAKSYAAFDAGMTNGVNTKGYYGVVFDGRFVYFVPRQNEDGYHTHILRYDTQGNFKDKSSWDVHNVGEAHSQQGAVFDGRYIYFCPGFSGDPAEESERSGRVIRYDTQGDFHSQSSYAVYDAAGTSGLEGACFDGGSFDGRYIYFVPLGQTALRYDTESRFDDKSAWEAIDGSLMGIGVAVGAVFDGRFMYYAAYGHGNITRFDTTKDFTDPDNWKGFDTNAIEGLNFTGYDGCFTDGRYIYFVPFVAMVDPSTPGCNISRGKAYYIHSDFVRYDLSLPFNDARSWDVFDASNTDGLKSFGYNAGAFDGRYFYCAPWQQARNRRLSSGGEIPIHGVVLRYDTTGCNGSFSLRYSDCGHNGGLCASVPGPSFLVNTEKGAISIAAHKRLSPGKHYLVGVYDSKFIKLYIDGQLVAQREASGNIQNNNVPVTVGKLHNGPDIPYGVIESVDVSGESKSTEAIKAAYDKAR